ncbi:MAG: hypothetical protein PVF43_01350 [Candidatus Eiseniibacteriota bacterium]|jgi:hypothetical protein
MRTVHAALCICLLAPLPLFAPARADVGSDEQPRVDRTTPRDLQRDFQAGLNPTMRGEITFSGTVLDQDQHAIAGIDVKLFIGGLLVEAHVTDSVGQYQFMRTIDFSRDETVMLWLVDRSRRYAPKAFVLDESEAASKASILSPCFIRLQVESTIESTVYMFDSETKAQALADRHCI